MKLPKTKQQRFIMPCYNLHDYAGHEFMYTKEIKSALINSGLSYDIFIYSRKDANQTIKNDLGCIPHFSHFEYRQDDNFFSRIISLIRREHHWFQENKALLISAPKNSLFFIHSFSIYSTWQWIFLNKYIEINDHELKLVIRYSEKLLPSYLKHIHRLICRLVGKITNAEMYTDSEELKAEYQKYFKKKFKVLSVMAETEVIGIDQAKMKSNKDTLNISYLGAARHDKGFHLLPSLVEYFCEKNFKVKFTIQCSVPGTKYIESSCEFALEKLQNLSRKYSNKIQLITQPVDQTHYRKLLTQASILLLPYIGETYKTQTSGILVEALTNGIPCIVPASTWLAKELNRTGGGTTFCVEEPDTLKNSLEDLIINFNKYNQLAVGEMNSEKLLFGANAQLKQILSL